MPETAVDFSGGGFSDVVRLHARSFFRYIVDTNISPLSIQFPRPFYQQLAVSKFLKNLAPGTYEGLYNPKGRVRLYPTALSLPRTSN